MVRYSRAFNDGLMTGLDILGTIYGHLNPNSGIYFSGYCADQYSDKFSPYTAGSIHWDSSVRIPEPVNRTPTEQFVKGIGTSIGVVSNILTLGLVNICFFIPDAIRELESSLKGYVRRSQADF